MAKDHPPASTRLRLIEVEPDDAPQRERPSDQLREPVAKPDQLGALFRAAAALFRAKTWAQIPPSEGLFSVTIAPLRIFHTVLLILGDTPSTFGFLLFKDSESFVEFVQNKRDHDAPDIPSDTLVFNFTPEEDLEPSYVALADDAGWELAAPDILPVLSVAHGEDRQLPSAADTTIAELVISALTHLVAEKRLLKKAWEGGDPLQRTFSLHTHLKELEITIAAPFRPETVPHPFADLLGSLEELSDDPEGFDHDEHDELVYELLERFDDAPESDGVEDFDCIQTMMNLAARHFGLTVATITPEVLDTVVFELFPRLFVPESAGAPKILRDLRAFFSFLDHEFDLEQAPACIQRLEDDAADRLEAEMSNPANFGPSKRMFLEGREAGYDMTTPASMEAFEDSLRPPSPSSHPPAQAAAAKKTQKAKKKRKPARKARRKNR